MPDLNTVESQPSLAALVGGLVEDTQQLVRQEAALARREIGEELDKTKEGATFMAFALVLFAQVGLLFAFTLVKVVQQFLLPNQEWLCFAIVTALFSIVGGLFLWAALTKFHQVNLMPRRSMESIREDVQAVTATVAGDRPQPNALLRQR
jgi:hypothetical protein